MYVYQTFPLLSPIWNNRRQPVLAANKEMMYLLEWVNQCNSEGHDISSLKS